MIRHHERKHPIFKKIFVPIFCLMIFQSALFFFAAVYGGIVGTMNQNSRDILEERVNNRASELEMKFNSRWANIGSCADFITNSYQTVTSQGGEPFYNNKDQQKQLLSESFSLLVNTLRNNEVNGIYLLLNNQEAYVPLQAGQTQELYGICIRDYDQNSSYTNMEDLLVLRCPSSIIPNLSCSLDSGWEAKYSFGDEYSGDFYYKPLEAAYLNPDVAGDNLAYFCKPYHLSTNDKAVVSYSMPLIDQNGYPYGVLGVELTVSYLETQLPSQEIWENKSGCYVLGVHADGENTCDVITSDGMLYQRSFGTNEVIQVDDQENGMIECPNERELSICGSENQLKIYNKNTPFENQKLVLIGLVEKSVLFAFGTTVTERLLIVSLITLLIGMMGIFLVSRTMTKPITKLAGKVQKMTANDDLKLERLNIDEIDELVNSIEDLSKSVSQSQARTEFFSRMSHDMRTPMNAIIGFSSPELLEKATDVQKEEYLDNIHSSGVYLLGLINEVLDITKIQSNKMELVEESVSMKRFWEQILPIIDETSRQKQIIFKKEFPAGDFSVYADSQRLGQIMVNLLSNAVKFTPPKGRVSISVQILTKEAGKLTQEIRIKDSGIGMSEEFQKKMYQPFEQEHTGKEQGTGLGLSITKQLIELMGGAITCNSELGEGTEFIVVLTNDIVVEGEAETTLPENSGSKHTAEEKRPVEIQVAESNQSAEKVVQVTDDLLAGKRILLCEDHPMNTQIATLLLKKRGILVEAAVNGAEGVKMFRASEENYYDAVLMDIRMPVMNGLEAASAIRDMKRKDAAEIPIIAMTANAFKEDMMASQEAGMNEHLSKPIEPQKLYGTLEQYLGKASGA